jgi:hypothetical protein
VILVGIACILMISLCMFRLNGIFSPPTSKRRSSRRAMNEAGEPMLDPDGRPSDEVCRPVRNARLAGHIADSPVVRASPEIILPDGSTILLQEQQPVSRG